MFYNAVGNKGRGIGLITSDGIPDTVAPAAPENEENTNDED